MKRNAFALSLMLAVAPLTSIAGVSVTPGNELQPSCNFKYQITDRNNGTLTSSEGYREKSKNVSTGKTVAAGDVVFYLALEKTTASYSSTKNAEIKDRSPLTADIQLVANRPYKVWGYYNTKSDGQKYVIINTPGYGLGIMKEDGFLCSDMLYDNNGWTFGGMPMAYQEVAFVKNEQVIADAKPIAIAITLKAYDSVSFTLEIAALVNGQVASRKSVAFDLFSGSASIGDMKIEVAADGKSGLKIKSITEPINYASWLKTALNMGN